MERYNKFKIDEILKMALNEDINTEDISTNAIYRRGERARAKLIAKEDGVLSGEYIFRRCYELLDDNLNVDFNLVDGSEFGNGEVLCTIEGDVRSILTGERTALNFLQRMCGVATKTRRMVQLLEGTNIDLLDTRKTTPNMRILEKYSVLVGGGRNHRFNLSDVIMLKDNHISAAGGVQKAIERAKKYAPYMRKIVVEVENLTMVEEALEAGVDIIMLDNMDLENIRRAIEIIDKRSLIECSGNLTLDNIKGLKDLEIDYISSGALTHSSGIIDMSLKELEIL